MGIETGDYVSGYDWPPAVQSGDGQSILNIQDTDYTPNPSSNGTDPRGIVYVYFTAPPSGKVGINVGGSVRNNSSGNSNRIFMTYQVRHLRPDGEIVRDSSADRGISNQATGNVQNFVYYGHVTYLDGLIAGDTYYCQIMIRASGTGNTVDINSRDLTVFPLP